MGGAEAEGAAREVRSARGGEGKYEAIAWSYHSTVLSVKLRQAGQRAADGEGGGCLLLDD